MVKRALIIRPDYNLLPGFPNSAACITQVLRERGFECASCESGAATRAGILAAYDALTERAGPDDAVVVYYAGHGGRLTNPSYTPEDDLPPYFQHLCPSDFTETTESDFRGISAPELSLQLAALTSKTKNVTVILECCFAAQMSRGEGDDPPEIQRVGPTLTRVGLTQHLQMLRQRCPEVARLTVMTNPDAVRVAATGRGGSAFHVTLPSASELRVSGIDLPEGSWIGAMTLGLVQTLAELGDRRISWRSVSAALRARLHLQRPEIDGPVDRVPFSLTTLDATMFSVRGDGDGGAIVDAGRLLGVSIGDVYAVMPAGSSKIDPELRIAEITIDQVSPVDSRAGADHVAWRPGTTRFPDNAVAIPSSRAFERYPVCVRAADAQRSLIEAELRSAAWVRPATPRDRDPLAELRVERDMLELRDEFGLLFPPSRFPETLWAAVRDLENLATARRLWVMADHQGMAPTDVSVELLAVDDAGRARVLADHDAALGLGDHVAIRLVNRTRVVRFCHVFNIGLRRRIAMLSDLGGIRLEPGATGYCGTSNSGPLVGFQPSWPTDLPTDQPRSDTVMVVVTPEFADLSTLETSEYLAKDAAPPPLPPLFDPGARAGDDQAPSPFAMYWRDFQLFPLSGSLDFGAPQVDASPPGAAAPQRVAAAVELRLDALRVAADTRVDILVCPRRSDTPFRAATLVGSTPSSLVLWSGPLCGVLDVYVWTSSTPGSSRTLTELLADQSISELRALLRAPASDSRSRLAVGASMRLAALARDRLRGADREVATAFHGSFGDDNRRAHCASAAVSFAIELEVALRSPEASAHVDQVLPDANILGSSSGQKTIH
jgi:hypothetical protein